MKQPYTYLISDIHGQFNDFKKLLEKVCFEPENDKLYILGDALDRGPDSLKTLNYIRELISDYPEHIFMLKGNHEYFAEMLLEGILDEYQHILWGGESTVRDVDRLDQASREDLLTFLKKLPYYFTLSLPGVGEVILTHSGLWAESIHYHEDGRVDTVKSLTCGIEEDEFRALVTKDMFYMPYSVVGHLDRFLIMGHVPTNRVNDDGRHRVFRTEYFMDIDCGAGHKKNDKNAKLCIFRTETNEEIYL